MTWIVVLFLGALVLMRASAMAQDTAALPDTSAGGNGNLDTLALAIFQAEQSGRMNRFNNPGNIKDVNTGRIRVFATEGEGWAALKAQLYYDFVGQSSRIYSPDMTFREFGWMWVCGGPVGGACGFTDQPDAWASTVATYCGVTVTTTVGDFLA